MAEVILIAEDDPQVVELLRIILETKQYEIFWAKDGEETMAMAGKIKPDLILLDIMMPKINGYEVMHLLKEDLALKDIPVIFLTAKGTMEDKVTGLKMGSHDYITKPFDIYELIARVEAALRLKNVVGPFRKEDRRVQDILLADPLTGVYAKAYFMERMEEELSRAQRYNYPIACLILDVDDYQRIKKKFGELSANQMLQHLAVLLKNSNRVVDVIGRLGTDRFVACLAQTDEGGLEIFGERLREKIQRARLLAADPQFQITVSLGGAALNNDTEGKSDFLINTAEAMLLQAKTKGKNNLAVQLEA